MSWSLFGKDVCYVGFCKLLAIGSSRVQKLLACLRTGAEPTDARSSNGNFGKREAYNQCDSFLQHVWSHMAEPLAETDLKECAYVAETLQQDACSDASSGASTPLKLLREADLAEHDLAAAASSGVPGFPQSTKKETRWLHPMTLTDLYDVFKARFRAACISSLS